MIDVNIDDFYRDIAVTLLTLLNQFPQKVSLYIEDVCGPDDVDEFGLHSPRYLSCVGAINWLHDEGYIRYSDIVRQESAENCTLTQKAFSLLVKPRIQANQLAHANLLERQHSTLYYQLHSALQAESGMDIRRIIEDHFFE